MLRKLVVVCLASAAALGAAEWACRLGTRRQAETLRFSESDLYYYQDTDGVRRHIPGKTGYERLWNGKGKAEFKMNSLGLRGPELGAKEPGATRVLFLGDSITLGGRLPLEETFVARVGRKSGVETVNAGVGDSGLAEQQELLDEVGPSVRPDLVVLCWYLNDGRPPVGFPEEVVYRNRVIAWLNRRSWARHSRLAGLAYEALRQALVRRQLGLMDRRSRRFDWVEPYARGRWVREPAEFVKLVEAARFDWGDAWDEASLAAMQRSILSVRELSRRLGARFALAVLPEHAQVYAQFDDPFVGRPQAGMAAFAVKNDIPFLDLLPALTRRRTETLFYDNCHYTPRGNAVVAEEIARFLVDKRLAGAAR